MHSLSARARPWGRFLLGGFAFLACAIRLALAGRDLPYYAIDENDLVEPALAFLCGSANPHWFAYGPLTSYLLAALFAAWRPVAGSVLGWSQGDFFQAAFFNPASFYFIARAFHGAVAVATAGLLWLFARRFSDAPTAVAALVIGLAPLLDLNTGFTVRIDTVQAFLGLGCSFFAALFITEVPRRGFFLASGSLAGLNLAAKPGQGLLLAAPVAAASLLVAWREAGTRAGPRLLAWAAHPGVWAFPAAALLAHSLSHPYSLLRAGDLWRENYRLLGVEIPGSRPGYDLRWLVPLWGWPFTLAALAALIQAWRDRDAVGRLLLAQLLTFVGACLFLATRTYWYNAVLPALFLLVARLLGRLAESARPFLAASPSMVAGLMAGLLVAAPTVEAARQAWTAWVPAPSFERRADRRAQLWIESHLPPGSRLLLVGYYSRNLPRLVADTPRAHGQWGEFFMYGRGRNPGWVEAFRGAYRRYRRSGGPVYAVENVRRDYSDRLPDRERSRRMDEEIAELARVQQLRYVVTASPHRFRGRWEDQPGVRLLALFGPSTGHSGDEVKVFEVRGP